MSAIGSQLRAVRTLAAALEQPDQPRAAFTTADAVCRALVGHRLFTLLVYDEASGEVARIYTSHPREYPVSGRKAMRDTPWGRHVIHGRQSYLGRSAADIRWAFPDHALIASLGCGSVINIPVGYDGRLLGTMNLLDAEGAYEERHLELVRPLAALLVPGFLSAISAARA
jgi:GAF domain-containing protein